MSPMMKCKACGKKISADAEVCPYCGKKDPTKYTEKEQKENDRWEVIEAIVGLVTFTILFGVFG